MSSLLPLYFTSHFLFLLLDPLSKWVRKKAKWQWQRLKKNFSLKKEHLKKILKKEEVWKRTLIACRPQPPQLTISAGIDLGMLYI